MPQLPALCDNCGAFFQSGIELSESASVTAIGDRSRCPRCGEWARVPDGVYEAFGSTLGLLAGPSQTIDDLRALQAALEELRRREASPDEVAEEISKVAPEIDESLVPQTRNELYAFVALLIAALSLIVQVATAGGGGDVVQDIDITNVYNTAVEKVSSSPPGTTTQSPKADPDVGRNDPCPCGSGEKYKRCCGAPGMR